jgi:hypothetical protein
MPEAGGPTTQSGIHYQNSIAALFLGRLCDTTSRPEYEKVISVRVEAPEKVDDIVVKFSDDHKLFIQAKENVTVGDDVWKKLWWDFEEQFNETNFVKGKDQLALWVGNNRDEFINLREICERSTSSPTYEDWQKRCNKAQKALLEKIKGIIHPETLQESTLLHFFQHLVIEIHPSQTLERDEINSWMPASNYPPITLFRLFRDKVGGESRIRGVFTSNSLLKKLNSENPSLTFLKPPDIEVLKESIKACSSILRQQKSTIGNTGFHFSREMVNDIVEWSIESSDDQKNVAMLIDQAGVGKTVALHDVQFELELKGIDVLAIKADQQLSGITQLNEIQTRLSLLESPEQILGRLAQLGRVVILIDQIDALSLSLAHDQATLDVILDLIARLRRIPNLRIVISCRIFDRNNDQRLKQIDIPKEFTLSQLTDDEISKFLNSIGILFQDLPEPTKILLRNPLHLNLFVLVLNNDSTRRKKILGVTSLQELYGAIWDNILLQDDSLAPSKTDRVEVIKLFTEYMSNHQVINVPKTYLLHPEMKHLEKTISWLASVGIIVESNTSWVFIHQTFFDYCFARDFVEQEKNLVKVIQLSDQGLFIRPLLLQVIAFMRGTNSKQYITTLSTLLSSKEIRYHLRDLLLNWFGSLSDPTDDEWIIAQRMLIAPENRPHVLQSMSGNSGWFACLRSTFLPNWLNAQVIDDSLLFYIISVSEINDIQLDVFTLLKPFVGKNEDWNNRLVRIVSQIRKWHSCEAVEFYQQVILNMSNLNRIDVYQIGEISKLFPKSGVSLLRFLLDFTLNQLDKSDPQNSSSFSIYDSLRILENNDLGEAFHIVSKAEPKLFLEAMLPWLNRVISFRDVPETPSPFYFVGDQLSWGWHDEYESIEHAIIFSIIDSLIEVAKSDSLYFTGVAQSLSQSPYRTPQLILVRAFLGLSSIYTSEALSFLLADRRRLDLGDIDAYDSRQLIQAIYPHLSSEKQSQLEEFILQPMLIDKKRGLDGLHWRGIEQLHLLQSIPQEFLSKKAKRQLIEWERKFPGSKPDNDPVTVRGGSVASPIPAETAKKMTDRQWLKAMNKYHGAYESREFLKGGAHQLSSVLQSLVKEDPKRYYSLLQRVNDDVDDAYVQAFINGLTESIAPLEWLFDTIRRFSQQPERNIKRTIAWSIEKRAKEEIPNDVVELLLQNVHAEPGDDEWWWAKGDNHGDVFSSFLNSDRGASLSALMRIYDAQGTDEAYSKKWELIEFIGADSSTALYIGAIHELTYMIRLDRNRALDSFDNLIKGHEILLESQFTREFIYWAFYQNYLRLQPYILSMMHHEKEEVQEQGAQLACIAGISNGAMESEEAFIAAQALAEKITSSSARLPWKKGAATIYSHNITVKPKDICIQKLFDLLKEEDKQIHDTVSRVFYSFHYEHFFALREFIETYARSSKSDNLKFAEFLLEYGLLDPEWTLAVVKIALDNKYLFDLSPWASGLEEIIRVVLRIYTNPTISDGIRKTSMDIFDVLMERSPGFSQKVLTEWDRR